MPAYYQYCIVCRSETAPANHRILSSDDELSSEEEVQHSVNSPPSDEEQSESRGKGS